MLILCSYAAHKGATVCSQGCLADVQGLRECVSISRSQMTFVETQNGNEPPDFWEGMGGKSPSLGRDFEMPQHRAKLHMMRLGEGYMELPQVVGAGARLESRLLDSNNVYILDDITDIWVWIGRRSSRLVRAAATKMCANLKTILPRPTHSVSFRVTEVHCAVCA